MVKGKFSDTLRMLKFQVSSDDKEQKENMDYFNLCFSRGRTCVSLLSITVIHTMSKGGFGRQVRATVEGSQGGNSRQELEQRPWRGTAHWLTAHGQTHPVVPPM